MLCIDIEGIILGVDRTFADYILNPVINYKSYDSMMPYKQTRSQRGEGIPLSGALPPAPSLQWNDRWKVYLLQNLLQALSISPSKM